MFDVWEEDMLEYLAFLDPFLYSISHKCLWAPFLTLPEKSPFLRHTRENEELLGSPVESFAGRHKQCS